MPPPIVDIFKQFKVHELKNVEVTGKVSLQHDKAFGRRIIQLDGNVTTSASIRIPQNKNDELDLKGFYVNHLNNIQQLYFQLQVSVGQIFMINIAYTLDGMPYSLSFSNLYKMIKHPTEHQLQIPCEPIHSWGTIIIYSRGYLDLLVQAKNNYNFTVKSNHYIKSKGIMLSGHLKIKNIFNSDILYQEPLPTEMMMFSHVSNSKMMQSLTTQKPSSIILLTASSPQTNQTTQSQQIQTQQIKQTKSTKTKKSPQRNKSLSLNPVQVDSEINTNYPLNSIQPQQTTLKSILKKSQTFQASDLVKENVDINKNKNQKSNSHQSPKKSAIQDQEKVRNQVVKALTPPQPIKNKSKRKSNSSSPNKSDQKRQYSPPQLKDIYGQTKDLLSHNDVKNNSRIDSDHSVHHSSNKKDHNPPHTHMEINVDDFDANQRIIQIKGIFGHSFSSSQVMQNIPWIKDHKYYITPANKYVQINQFAEEGTHKTLIEQPSTIKSLGICGSTFYVLLQDKILQLYDAASQQLIKSIYLNCVEVLNFITSLCSNYALALVSQNGELAPHIQMIQLSSGKVLTSSILQGASVRQKIFIDFVGGQYDLQFVVLSSAITQLWRVSPKGTLEFMDLECARNSDNRSACTLLYQNITYLVIGQGFDISFFDLRQARLVVEAKNITKQPIIQMIASQQNLVIITQSPNIYYYHLQGSLANLLEHTTPFLISLDSIPVAHSMLHNHEIIVAARSGQVWFVDLDEKITLKLQSSLAQSSTINQAQYQSNAHLAICAVSDGTVSIQNTKTNESIIEYLAPKRNCLSVVVFDTNNIVAAGYDDSMIRFFNLKDNTVIGNCKLPSAVTKLCAIPKHFVLLSGTHCGQISIISLTHEKQIYRVHMQTLETNIGSPISSLVVNKFDFTNVWASCSIGGKVLVYERKKLKDQDIVLDRRHHHETSDLENVTQLEYYLVDQVSKNLRFSDTQNDIIMIGYGKVIIIRDFREHTDLRSIDLLIDLKAFVVQGTKLIVLSEDQNLCVYDQDTMIEIDRKQLFIGQSSNSQVLSKNSVCYQNLVIFYNIH